MTAAKTKKSASSSKKPATKKPERRKYVDRQGNEHATRREAIDANEVYAGGNRLFGSSGEK